MPGFVQGGTVTPKKTGKQPYLINGNEHQNLVLGRAFEISKDEEFLCTLLGENIKLTADLKHDFTHSLCWNWESWRDKQAPYQPTAQAHCRNNEAGWFWRTHTDWGFGISDGYYKRIVDDPKFSDWEWQLEQTYTLWKGGTKFYGQQNCWYTKTLIEWK